VPSLKTSFDELLSRIRQGRELGHAGFEPIYYLIFAPRQILEVKRAMPAWTARLRNDGYDVQVFSVAAQIDDILAHAPLRRIWLAADRKLIAEDKMPEAWTKTNEALANMLRNGALVGRLQALLEQQRGKPNAIVLVTDMEALHPYMRPGVIETQLYGQYHAPTVFLYPGERAGNTRLKFLGFYPEDGNYRSVHVGE
jgi:hypothetical protein